MWIFEGRSTSSGEVVVLLVRAGAQALVFAGRVEDPVALGAAVRDQAAPSPLGLVARRASASASSVRPSRPSALLRYSGSAASTAWSTAKASTDAAPAGSTIAMNSP